MGGVLAIDQGTSGTKAVVVSENGEVLAAAEYAIRPRYRSGGAVEQDPEELFASVLRAGTDAVAAAGVEIEAVALANQGESVLAWDPETGRPLTPLIVWQDRRADAWCRARADQSDHLLALTGLELDPYFSAPKMRWIRDNLTTMGIVTTSDTWIIHRLCGALVTDSSTASRSLLLNLDTMEWSAELSDFFELDHASLPRIVASDEIVGETTAFGRSAPVVGLIVDQQAALLAQACVDPGMAKCTFGTGAFILAQQGTAAVRSRRGLTSSVAWTLRDSTHYCLDGQVYTAASAVRWAVDAGFLASAADIDDAAASDSDGVLFVPTFAGSAAPWWNPQSTATVTGMRLDTGSGYLVRALAEGIATQVTELITLMGQEMVEPLTRLRVDGGLTRSRVLMQAQADLAQLPVDVYPSAHATPLGAAICARLALDPTADLRTLVSRWKSEITYEPMWSADRAHDHLSRWRKVAGCNLSEDTP